MSHENSQTIGPESDGRYYNVNAHTGEVLTPIYPFEDWSYSTLEEAVEAAYLRSMLFHQQTRGHRIAI